MATNDVPRTAVNQSPGGGTDYPFLGESNLAGRVLDVYVHLALDTFRLPFVLDASDVGDNVISFTVSDADFAEVLAVNTGDAGYSSTAWGDRTVHMWVREAFVFRVVMAAGFDITAQGVLDPRTFHATVPAVAAIVVNGETLTGDVTLRKGYNSAPTAAGNRVTLSAAPGDGLGRVPGCQDPTPVLRQINRIPADEARNFTLSFDPCFRAQRPLVFSPDAMPTASFATDDDAHTLQVADDCRPCMTCDDVVRTYKGLRRVWDRWKTLAGNAETVRDQVVANRERWIAARECRLLHPSTLVASPDTACKAFVGGAFCNVTSCCLRNLELRFTLQKYSGGAPVSWAGGGVTKATLNDNLYSPIVSGQVVRFFLDALDPNQSMVATMKFLSTACAVGDSLIATMTTHMNEAGNDPNGEPCLLPSASVPADILAIWATYGVPLLAARTVDTRAVGVAP